MAEPPTTRSRRRVPRTPAALWAHWAQRHRQPGCLSWTLLPLAWGFWAWTWVAGQVAGWFLAPWILPGHLWLLSAGWALWREEGREALRRLGWVGGAWVLTLVAGGVVGALTPGAGLEIRWWSALPWMVLASWMGTWMLVGLLPWWPDGPALMGVLWAWAGFGPLWMAGALWARSQASLALFALLSGLASWVGSWGVLFLAFAWIKVRPLSPRRWVVALMSGGLGLLFLGAFWWGGSTVLDRSALIATPIRPPVVLSPEPMTATPTPNPVEIIPGPPTPTWTPSPSPTPSPTFTPSPTWTVTPSPTVPTPTPPPPTPTPLLAFIQAPEPYNGAVVRAEPDFNARVITTLLNGTRVLVLEPERVIEGVRWTRIRTLDGRYEGWVMQQLLVTATPPPQW